MTYKKIAELAHVSVSTVSKALSGSSEISGEMAERIIRIAIEIGYFKEKSKRKLEYTKNRELLVAVLCPEIISVFYSRIVTLIKQEVEARGGNVCVYIYDLDNEKFHRILETILLRSNADGIILFRPPALTVTPDIPIVCLSENSQEHHSVYFDTDAILFDAVGYLKKSGHFHIGFIGEANTLSKEAAYRQALKAWELPYDPAFVHIVDKRFEAIGYEAAHRILAARRNPTAFIAAYDEVAMGTISELGKHGLRVPEDIFIMGINDIPTSAYAQIPLTTVNLCAEDQCAKAVRIICDDILDRQSEIRHIAAKHTIVQRETVRKR